MKNILEISKDLKFKSPKKDAEFIFDKNNTGISKNIFIDKDSKLQKTTHYYNNHRCDGIWWYANHKTFQNLSLLLFASLFCEKYPHIEITFSHSQSEIKTFIIPTIASTKKQKNFFLVTKPLSYTYIRQQCLKHPWMQQSRTSPAEFPVFSLLENKEKHHRSNYETLHTLKLQNTST